MHINTELATRLNPRRKGGKRIVDNVEKLFLYFNMRACLEERTNHYILTCFCMDTGLTRAYRFSLSTHQINKRMLYEIKRDLWRELKKIDPRTRITSGLDQIGPATNIEIRTAYTRLAGDAEKLENSSED